MNENKNDEHTQSIVYPSTTKHIIRRNQFIPFEHSTDSYNTSQSNVILNNEQINNIILCNDNKHQQQTNNININEKKTIIITI